MNNSDKNKFQLILLLLVFKIRFLAFRSTKLIWTQINIWVPLHSKHVSSPLQKPTYISIHNWSLSWNHRTLNTLCVQDYTFLILRQVVHIETAML